MLKLNRIVPPLEVNTEKIANKILAGSILNRPQERCIQAFYSGTIIGLKELIHPGNQETQNHSVV